MRLARALLLSLAALALAACAGNGGAPAWTYGPTAPPASAPGAPSTAAASPSTAAASPSAAASPPSSAGAASAGPGTRIEVKLNDQLKIEPAVINVPAGIPVTFVVTNVGALDHEFFVGDERAQAAREAAMAGATTAPPDQANLVGVKPGQTKELTVTFPAAPAMLAGCHIAGHYLAGMKATIAIK